MCGTNLVNTQKNWPIIAGVFKEWSFVTPLNLVGLLGTIAVETASSFAPVREAYYLYDYDPVRAEELFQLNPEPAYRWYRDTSQHAAYSGGPDYHGRGFIQTTHDYNYVPVRDYTGIDVVTFPDLLLTNARLSAIAMCIYWDRRSISAMCEARNWLDVRRAVYGGIDYAGAERMVRIAARLGW